MSADKHTPGPWKHSPDASDGWTTPYEDDAASSSCMTIAGERGTVVAFAVMSSDRWVDKAKDAELEANAHLIAAAPELLAALREAYTAFAHDDEGPVWADSTIAKTQAAIAKATGGAA